MASTKISISLPEGLVKVVDSEAKKKKKLNRSALITKILIDNLYVACPTCGNVRETPK